MYLPSVWKYDLRPLFLDDPFDNSGVYDNMSHVLLEGRPKRVETLRGRALKYIRSEVEVQDGIARLLLADLPIPLRSSSVGTLSKEPRFVMSELTIRRFFQEPYEVASLKYFRHMPKALRERLKLLERPIYVHPRIPTGILLSCGYPEHVGVLTYPQLFPYPVGLGRFKEAPIKAFRVSL